MTSTNAENKLSNAKAYLMLKHPFYASILLRLKFHEVDDCPTMYTDGLSIGYNSQFIDTLSKLELVGVLVHEVEHIILLHFARLRNRNIKVWNMAGDYAINAHLLSEDFQLPKDCLFNPKYKNCYKKFKS